MNLSIVIPAYNEAENIKLTIQELISAVNEIPEVEKFDIIVIDDHSIDNTFKVVESIDNSRIRCLRLSRRSGSHIAIRAGMKAANGDVVLCVSADGQDNPAGLREMLEKWLQGVHVVWALRKDRKCEPWYIRRPAKLFYKILILLGGAGRSNIDLSMAGFCMLDKVVVDALNKCAERNSSIFGLIAWLGFSQDFVLYQRRPRRSGRSKWCFTDNLRLAKDWIVGFSGLPLTLIFIFGALMIGTGLFSAMWIVSKVILGKSISNSILVIIALLVFSGIQMMMLGVLGEYIWNNLEEARHRPLYFIEKETAGIKVNE